MYIHTIRSNCACIYVCISVRTYMYVLIYIWMCAVCIVHVQDTYTNVYVQDTYTNVYRTHMHMHAYMHAYIHTLVGSGPLFPQSVLQCLCSCAAFRRILCSIAICVCVCVCHGVCVTVCVCVCVECNRDHHSEILRAGMYAPLASCQRELTLSTKSRQREEASDGLKHGLWSLEHGSQTIFG